LRQSYIGRVTPTAVGVNMHTYGQWMRYCAERGLSAIDRVVLLVFVHDHSAAEGITRPGDDRLERMTGAANTTIDRSKKRLTAVEAIVLHRPRRGRLAAEYRLPWLRNSPRSEVANATTNATTNATPPLLLRRRYAAAAADAATRRLRVLATRPPATTARTATTASGD
jgi:hypothetical protein